MLSKCDEDLKYYKTVISFYSKMFLFLWNEKERISKRKMLTIAFVIPQIIIISIGTGSKFCNQVLILWSVGT